MRKNFFDLFLKTVERKKSRTIKNNNATTIMMMMRLKLVKIYPYLKLRVINDLLLNPFPKIAVVLGIDQRDVETSQQLEHFKR